MSAPQRNLASFSVGALLAMACLVGDSDIARADGAFPNSQSVLLPRDRSAEILVGTTFGLVFSENDGRTWRYSCETNETAMGRQYLLAAPPSRRILALSDLGIPVTNDGACTWTIAGGDITPATPIDVFPDPSDSQRAYALAVTASIDGLNDGPVWAYRSLDGGRSFSGPIFTPPEMGVVTGIESAASDPQIVYVTFYEQPGSHPRLGKSLDGGETWTTMDIEPGVGAVLPYLAAVDRADANRVYLRITSGIGDPAAFEGLAITTDAGASWSIPLKVADGSLAGLARLPNGNLFAIGSVARPTPTASPPPVAFRSDDGGLSFTTEALAFHAAGLGERNGILYVATNDFLDGFALASSDDAGRTWRPRLRFRDISGVRDCVRSSCQRDCDLLAGVKLFPPETCNPPPPAKGCGCGLGSFGGGGVGGTAGERTGALLLLAGVVWLRQRRRPSDKRRDSACPRCRDCHPPCLPQG